MSVPLNVPLFSGGCIGTPIILGRCPSLSAHESESVLRTYLVCREKREKEREKQANGTWERHSDPTTSTSELLLRQNSVTARVDHS
jgi:hypothetical protein